MKSLRCYEIHGNAIILKLAAIVPPLDTDLIGIKPYSNHPDDSHLWIVLCKRPDNERQEFIVWTLNTQDPGYYNGAYYEDYKDALDVFNRRGV